LGRLKSWQAYAFAIVVTAATLGVRLALDGPLGGRPTLVIFTVPIMLSAYLGGLRAGLLATGLSYFAASYYLLPPLHSFAVASAVDRWQQFFVAVVGVLISALNEAGHRTRGRAAIATRERQEMERDRQRFFTLSRDVVCVLGFDGYFRDVNPAWEQTLGFTKAELLATPFIEFVHPDDREATLAEARKLAGGTPLIDFENRYRRRDGSYRLFLWSVTPVVENGVMYGIARDITERKQGERAAILLAAIVDSSDDAIIGKDLNGIITSWNRGAEKLFSYTAGEMVGNSIMRLLPADRQDEENEILARIGRGESVEHFETLRQTKDGRQIEMSITASPIKDSTGKVTGVSKVARCITERKQAEAALRESEALLHASDRRLAEIVHGMTEACFTLDAQWRFSFVNDRCETQFHRTRQQVLGRSIWELFPELLGTPMEAHYRRAMAERAPVSVEAFSPVAERWLDIRLFPTGDGIAAFLLDVHARKLGEEARRASEARYRTLFECAPDGIVIADPAGVYLEANGSICQMLGYTREEMIGLPSSRIVAEAESPHIGPALSAINTETPYHREWLFRRKDQSLFAAEVIATRMPDGNLLAMIHDITERKRIEARMRRLVDSNAQGVMFWNRQGAIIKANDAFLRMVGYTREDLAAARIDWAKMTPPEYADLDRQSLEALAATGVCPPIEKEYIRKDGSRVPVMIGAAVFEDSPDEGVCFALDLTERRRTEATVREGEERMQLERRTAAEKIQKLNTELEQRVTERTAQLEAANQELEAFSYSVSHDLRAPLRGVHGYVRMLKEDCADQLDAEGNRMLDVVSSEAKRMGHLVDDLLAFSRLGREPMKSNTVDMDDLADAVFETSIRMAPESAPRFERKSLPLAQGDLSMLRQVFVNLIGNAIKFTRHQAAAVVEVGSRSGDGETTYYVSDNGVGFDEKYGHKLFGVFQRLHSEEEFEGTGVGLALVQRVIHRHGGKVWAEGKPNLGATFYFTLPTPKESANEHSH